MDLPNLCLNGVVPPWLAENTERVAVSRFLGDNTATPASNRDEEH